MENKSYIPKRYEFSIEEEYARVPNSNDFKCVFESQGCDKTFTSRGRLEKHVNNACRYSAYFVTANKLQGFEMLSEHEFCCEFCDKKFATKFKCFAHLRKIHWAEITYRNYHPAEFTEFVIKPAAHKEKKSVNPKRKVSATATKPPASVKLATETATTSSAVFPLPLLGDVQFSEMFKSTIIKTTAAFPISLRDEKTIIVPDTNVFLKYLDLVVDVSTRRTSKIAIAKQVLDELDGHKKGSDLKGKQARDAINLINCEIRELNYIGQSNDDAAVASVDWTPEDKDEKILHYAVQLSYIHKADKIILWTDDTNLDTKSLLNNVSTAMSINIKNCCSQLDEHRKCLWTGGIVMKMAADAASIDEASTIGCGDSTEHALFQTDAQAFAGKIQNVVLAIPNDLIIIAEKMTTQWLEYFAEMKREDKQFQIAVLKLTPSSASDRNSYIKLYQSMATQNVVGQLQSEKENVSIYIYPLASGNAFPIDLGAMKAVKDQQANQLLLVIYKLTTSK